MSDVDSKSIKMAVSPNFTLEDAESPVVVSDGTSKGTHVWVNGKKLVLIKELNLKITADNPNGELHLVFSHYHLQLDGTVKIAPEDVKILEWTPSPSKVEGVLTGLSEWQQKMTEAMTSVAEAVVQDQP